MRTRLLPLLIASSMLGTLVPASAGDVVSNLPTEPKKRLEAIQHALVNAAMEGNTRVRNAAWVDSNGRLHENTRITSDMKLRNVRVLNYLTVEDGVSAAIVAEGRGVTPDEEVCRANLQRYRREATLDVVQRIPANGMDAHEWQGFLAQARSRFVARAHAGRKWLLTASTPAPATSYERSLLGYTADITPYQMVLDVLPAGALGIEPVRPQASRDEQARQVAKAVKDYVLDEPEKRAPVPFVVRLSVYERVNQRLLWQDAVPLFFPERAVRHTSQPLPVGLLTELDNVIGRWQQRLDNEFACRPQSFHGCSPELRGSAPTSSFLPATLPVPGWRWQRHWQPGAGSRSAGSGRWPSARWSGSRPGPSHAVRPRLSRASVQPAVPGRPAPPSAARPRSAGSASSPA